MLFEGKSSTEYCEYNGKIPESYAFRQIWRYKKFVKKVHQLLFWAC